MEVGGHVVDTEALTVGGKGLLSVDVKQQLWVPLMQPCMNHHLRLSVWDKDTLGDDELVAVCPAIDWRQVRDSPRAFRRFWLELYGPPHGEKYKVHGDTARYDREFATCHRGPPASPLARSPDSSQIPSTCSSVSLALG